MTESYAEFLARTSSKPTPLPAWASALVFLAVFSVLQMGYSAGRGSWFEHFVIGDLTVAPSAAVIQTLTPEVHVKALGNQLVAPGGGIVVLKGCEGTEVMFMLIAAFAAVVMPWRRRLTGLGLGILLVFCLNQVRLVGLFYAYRSDPSLFNLLHGTLAPMVLVIAVALYTLYWFQSARDPIQPNERLVRDFALRLVIIAAILLTLGRIFAAPLVTPLLPAFAWVIEAADSRFRVDSLAIVERQTDTYIESKVTPVSVLIISNRRLLFPDAKLHFNPRTLVGSVLQPIILFLSVILAWPLNSLGALPIRLLVAVPATALLLLVNFPLGLVGVMLDFRQLFPDAPVSPFVYWNDFLQTGGPLALAVAAGALVVSAGDALAIKRDSRLG